MTKNKAKPTLKKQPYKGCRDFFPQSMRVREHLFSQLRRVAEQFAFEPYDAPLLEEVDLYLAKSGEELINDQIYAFEDRGGRRVAIRPEMTPSLARMVAQVHRQESMPIRWYALPNLMRYERPQRGRLREHWQFNADIFGATGERGLIEIMQLVVAVFETFGANQQHFELRFNDRRLVEAFFKHVLCVEGDQAYQLYKIIDRAKKISPEQLNEQLSHAGLNQEQRTQFERYLASRSLDALMDIFESGPGQSPEKLELQEAYQRVLSFEQQCQVLGLADYLVYDPSIVRGLDYYTGIVFEVFDKHPDNRRALCGGGAYDNLLAIFNEPALPGVGFGLGDVTLLDFLKTHGLDTWSDQAKVDVLVSFQCEEAYLPSQQLAAQLRRAGLKVSAQPQPVKMQKVFATAERRHAQAVVIFGSDELSRQCFQLKHLATRQQHSFGLEESTEAAAWLRGLGL